MPLEENDKLYARTKDYAIRIIRLYSTLVNQQDNGLRSILGRQLLRSGTSVGAHYREACRGRSSAEFVSKMEGGLQELEETLYWFELLTDSGTISKTQLAPLLAETRELLAMFISSINTTKRNHPKKHGGS